MLFRGRPVVMAVGHHFMVDPDRRHTLAALKLLRVFRSGPQHLLLAEANDVSRRLWEGVHGRISFLHSLRWVSPLQPARYLASALRRQGFVGASSLLAPLAGVVDLIASRRAPGNATPRVTSSHLDDDTLADSIRQISRECELGPDYDARSITWLLGLLACRRTNGSLQRVMLRTPRGEMAGWYLYFLKPGGTSEVVQIAGRRRWLGDVFDHLLGHARAGGAFAVSGRLDPPLVPICAARQCFYRGGGSWTLVDSPNPDILGAIHCGNAFLTRLEGEWWIGY
jgi:hypothetical protein